MKAHEHAHGAELVAALARARLLALDVDGTLTDGGIAYEGSQKRRESLRFHVHDGIALEWLRGEGLVIAWISGRNSHAAVHRARDLKIDVLALGVRDKFAELERIQAERSIDPADTIAMGDDLPDLGLRARAAVFAAPIDAREEVRSRASIVTPSRAGHGAVRDLAEAILRARGRFDALVAGFAR